MAWIDVGTDEPRWVSDDAPGLIAGDREGYSTFAPPREPYSTMLGGSGLWDPIADQYPGQQQEFEELIKYLELHRDEPHTYGDEYYQKQLRAERLAEEKYDITDPNRGYDNGWFEKVVLGGLGAMGGYVGAGAAGALAGGTGGVLGTAGGVVGSAAVNEVLGGGEEGGGGYSVDEEGNIVDEGGNVVDDGGGDVDVGGGDVDVGDPGFDPGPDVDFDDPDVDLPDPDVDLPDPDLVKLLKKLGITLKDWKRLVGTDWNRLLGTGVATGLSLISDREQRQMLERLAAQNRSERQPFLSAATNYIDPNRWIEGPGQAFTKGTLQQLSARHGNPISSPTAMGIATDASMGNWLSGVNTFGSLGLGGQGIQANLGVGAADARGDTYRDLARGFSDVMNPRRSLADLEREFRLVIP